MSSVYLNMKHFILILLLVFIFTGCSKDKENEDTTPQQQEEVVDTTINNSISAAGNSWSVYFDDSKSLDKITNLGVRDWNDDAVIQLTSTLKNPQQ